MDSKVSAKLVSLFLVFSVCLLGYTAMSTWGAPTPTNGMVSIDKSILIYQGNNINYTFANNAVIPSLEIGYDYIKIGTLKINSTISTGYLNTSLITWDNTHSIRWKSEASNSASTANFTISGLLQNTTYQYYLDYHFLINEFKTNANGEYSFNYSLWSEHQFEIRNAESTLTTNYDMLILISIFVMGLLIVAIIIVYSERGKKNGKT